MEPIPFPRLVNYYVFRYIDNTVDVFTGRDILIKEEGKFREPTDMDVVSPLEIYQTEMVYIKGVPFVDGPDDSPILLRSYLKKTIGIKSESEFMQALGKLASGPLYPGWGWWFTLPLFGILILILYFSLFHKNKKQKQ